MTDAEDRRLAVLDRFEGDEAVLLIEVDGEIVDEWVLPTEDLPEAGRKQDAVFAVDGEAGQRAGALEFLPEKKPTGRPPRIALTGSQSDWGTVRTPEDHRRLLQANMQ